MKAMKLYNTETVETRNQFSFSDGVVKVVERETREIYRSEHPAAPRLVIENAIVRTKDLIIKSRAEISGLNAVLQELTVK